MNLLNRQIWPHPSSLNAEPFTAVEIDDHVDCARIWATISSLRNDAGEEMDVLESDNEMLARALEESPDDADELSDIKLAIVKLKTDGFQMKDLRALYELVGLEL